jgi:hypothetical protein
MWFCWWMLHVDHGVPVIVQLNVQVVFCGIEGCVFGCLYVTGSGVVSFTMNPPSDDGVTGGRSMPGSNGD